MRRGLVLRDLGVGGRLCGDNAHCDLGDAELSPGVDDHEVFVICSESERGPAIFGIAMFCIVDADGEGIAEHQGRALKRDAMFADIGQRFGGIPLEVIDERLAHALAFCLMRSASMKVSMSCTI